MTSHHQRGRARQLGVKPRDADRSKNFFALGLITWMYTRPVEPTIKWIESRFAKNELVLKANLAAFKAGFNFGETAELFDHVYEVRPASLEPGVYTNINGNTALAWGIVAAGQCAKLPVFFGSYPITPASDILHELSKHKNFGVRTMQAEDEIAAIGPRSARPTAGISPTRRRRVPGMALKGETMGLAVSLELPLVIIDIQRGGPSTGLPTKTEAADLLMAMYGRHGEVADADRVGLQPVALLRSCDRGVPHRVEVPHAGDLVDRRLSRQWHRAVAAARRRLAARHLDLVRDRAQPRRTPTAPKCSGPTCATRTSPANWRCPARPG